MECSKCHTAGVRNTVLGKEFYYCRTCKDEITLSAVASPALGKQTEPPCHVGDRVRVITNHSGYMGLSYNATLTVRDVYFYQGYWQFDALEYLGTFTWSDTVFALDNNSGAAGNSQQLSFNFTMPTFYPTAPVDTI